MRQPRTLQPIWMVLLATIIATLGLGGCRTVSVQDERTTEKEGIEIPEIPYERFVLENGLILSPLEKPVTLTSLNT